jgi:hypothetical protein
MDTDNDFFVKFIECLLREFLLDDGSAMRPELASAMHSVDGVSVRRGRKRFLKILMIQLTTRMLPCSELNAARLAFGLLKKKGIDLYMNFREMYGVFCQGPKKTDMVEAQESLKYAFFEHWKVYPTPNGIRVSLLDAVRFVGLNVYGLDSIQGTRVDIWGDGMERGTTGITRMCFRFCDLGKVCWNWKSENVVYQYRDLLLRVNSLFLVLLFPGTIQGRDVLFLSMERSGQPLQHGDQSGLRNRHWRAWLAVGGV